MKTNSMKKTLLAASILMAFPIAAVAGLPATGIQNTHHDFATGGTKGTRFMSTQTPSGDGATVDGTVNSVGLCSYCHTPHSAQSTLLLWNHSLSSNTFNFGEALTSGGTAYASITPAYKGPTVKCLSCHDGSVAIGDVGWYKEGPGVFNTFKVGSTGYVPADPITGLGGVAGDGADIIATGSSLSGNHPVGMAYPFGQAKSTYNGTTTGGNVILTEFVGDPQLSATAKIKLYTDTSGSITVGAKAGATGLECSTCHDPHNKSTVDDLLLRGKMQGSTVADGYICVQCHIK